MRILRTCCLVFTLAFTAGMGFSQDSAFFEDELPKYLLVRQDVTETVSKLRVLRRQVRSLGEKHPSRPSVESQISDLERFLQKIVRENEDRKEKPSLRGSPTSPVIENKKDISQKTTQATPKPTVHDDTEVRELKAREFIPEKPDEGIDSVGSHDPYHPESVSELDGNGDIRFELDLAYPWMKPRRFMAIGRFPRSCLMWGIERNDEKNLSSIWKWRDQSRVVQRTLFWETEGTLVDMCPSPNIDVTGIWFCVRVLSNSDRRIFEILRGQISSISEGGEVSHTITAIARGDLDEDLPITLLTHQIGYGKDIEVTVNVGGRSSITHLSSVVHDLKPVHSGFRFLVQQDQYPKEGDELRVLNEAIRTECEDKCVYIDGSDETICYFTPDQLRPFWQRKGGHPTLEPPWYSSIGKITKEVFYDHNVSIDENGKRLARALSSLRAGDRVRVHEGIYNIDGYFQISAKGTAIQPVVIEGAPGERVEITRPNASQNVLNVMSSKFLVLRNLEVRGGGTGIKIFDVSDFMLFDCRIYDTGGNAIAANSATTSYLYFVDNEIFGTRGNGEGLYLGSHDGSFVAHHCSIIGNYIHDLAKGEGTQGDGIELKDGSYGNVIRGNYIARTQYPGVVVYRTNRSEEERNIIEENVIVDTVDAAIQVSADALIRNNFVFTKSTAFFSKAFKTNPKAVALINNTFISGGSSIKVNKWNATDLLIANNAIHSGSRQIFHSGSGLAKLQSNVFVRDLDSAFEEIKWDGFVFDSTPKSGSQLVGSAFERYIPQNDITGSARAGRRDVGSSSFRSTAELIEQRQQSSRLFSFGVSSISRESLEVRVMTQDSTTTMKKIPLYPRGIGSTAVYVGPNSRVLSNNFLVSSADGFEVWGVPHDTSEEPVLVYRGQQKVLDIGIDTVGDPILLLEEGCFRAIPLPPSVKSYTNIP